MKTAQKAPRIEGSNHCEDFEWQDLCEDLTCLMDEFKHNGVWRGEVTGFGWTGSSGYKVFKAVTGRDLLSQVLPNTDCTFKVYKEKDCIKIDNAHHDKPCGGEWYVIKPHEETDDDQA